MAPTDAPAATPGFRDSMARLSHDLGLLDAVDGLAQSRSDRGPRLRVAP